MRRNKAALALVLGVSLLAGCGQAANTNTKETKQQEVQEVALGEYTAESIREKLVNISAYDETYINEIAKTVNTVNEKTGEDDVSYVFITDTHIGKSSDLADDAWIYGELQAAVDVANNSDASFLCLGGDIEDGRFAPEAGGKQTALDILQKVSDVLKSCKKPVFILKGNHDDNSFSAQAHPELLYDPEMIINSTEWYQATMANFSQYATDYKDGYYYYDLPDKNTRVICLNMSNSSDEIVDGSRVEMGMYYYGYHDEQIDWLLNTAMTRQDCRYIILSHDGFEYTQGYTEDSNRDTLEQIFAAAYHHTNFVSDKFAKDFTDWTGKVLMFNNGHMHMEKLASSDVAGGMPTLCTETASVYNYGPVAALPSPWNTYTRTEGRTLGNVTAASFDVVVYREKASANGTDDIQVVRFGNGEDTSYATNLK